MEEIWKDVPGYEGLYQVSNFGRVSKVLKPHTKKSGHKTVGLVKNGKSKTCFVHRLVYSAFSGVIPDNMVINHKDEDPGNNTFDNLMLCTQKENSNWGTRNTRISEKMKNHKSLSKWVIQLNENNEILHFYPSSRQAERETGITSRTIRECCSGKLKKIVRHNKVYYYPQKTAGGYIWKHAE